MIYDPVLEIKKIIQMKIGQPQMGGCVRVDFILRHRQCVHYGELSLMASRERAFKKASFPN